MKIYIKVFFAFLFLGLFSGCSVDRLALIIRRYNSGVLIHEKDDKLEDRFTSAKMQFSADRSKKLLILYIEGLTYEKRKNYSKALNCFKKAVEQNNAFLDAWLHIAKLNLLSGNTREAYVAYLKCIDLIDNEIAYIDANKWPEGHLFLDEHAKYAIRYTFIDNSYLPVKNSNSNRDKIDYNIIRKNLTILKQNIIKYCQDLKGT